MWTRMYQRLIRQVAGSEVEDGKRSRMDACALARASSSSRRADRFDASRFLRGADRNGATRDAGHALCSTCLSLLERSLAVDRSTERSRSCLGAGNAGSV